jgi:hypothetical protein
VAQTSIPLAFLKKFTALAGQLRGGTAVGLNSGQSCHDAIVMATARERCCQMQPWCARIARGSTLWPEKFPKACASDSPGDR